MQRWHLFARSYNYYFQIDLYKLAHIYAQMFLWTVCVTRLKILPSILYCWRLLSCMWCIHEKVVSREESIKRLKNKKQDQYHTHENTQYGNHTLGNLTFVWILFCWFLLRKEPSISITGEFTQSLHTMSYGINDNMDLWKQQLLCLYGVIDLQ